MHKAHVNLGVCLSAVILFFGIAIFTQSTKMTYWSGYGPGDGFVSLWASGFLMFFATISLYQSAKETGIKLSEVLPKGKGLYNLLITWAGLLFFVVFAQKFGFTITASVMMFFLYTRGYKWHHAIALSLIVTIVCYVVFKTILQVPLPLNEFGW